MQTIGERLEEARKRKGITIREAAEATKIRGDYLSRFEGNQFDIGMADIYVRGFLRSYANFLKLPAERIVSDFEALGPEEDRKGPKTPSREIYGRMELSIASSGSAAESADAAAEAHGAEGTGTRKFARIGTSLPEGPIIEGRLLLKIGAIVAGVALLLLIVWAVANLSSSSGKGAAKPAVTAQAGQGQILFRALDKVHIKVAAVRDANDTVGQVIFQGQLARGETRVFPKTGALFLTATALESIEFEMGGKRVAPSAYGYKGYDRIKIE